MMIIHLFLTVVIFIIYDNTPLSKERPFWSYMPVRMSKPCPKFLFRRKNITIL